METDKYLKFPWQEEFQKVLIRSNAANESPEGMPSRTAGPPPVDPATALL